MPALLSETLQVHRQEQEKHYAFLKNYCTNFDLVIALPDGSPWPPDDYGTESA